MPYLDLTIPLVAKDPTGGWASRQSVLKNDAAVATLDATLTGAWLYILDFEDVLPADAQVAGITGHVVARASVADLEMEAALTLDGENVWGTAKTIVLGTTLQDFALGGAADLWGTGGLTLSSLRGNERFGFVLRSKTAQVGNHQVQYAYLRVHYTTVSGGYATGSRSSFPREIDDIALAANGTGPSNQVRTGDHPSYAKSPGVNLLADALFNIEKAIVQGGDAVRLLGSPQGRPLYLFTITITARIDDFTQAGLADYQGWEVLYHEDNGVVRADEREMSESLVTGAGASTVERTFPPLPSSLVSFDFVQGVGWLKYDGGIIEPLNVTAKSLMAVNDGRHWAFYMGFTASTLNALTQLVSNDGYRGVHLGFDPPTAGDITIKLLAIGGM